MSEFRPGSKQFKLIVSTVGSTKGGAAGLIMCSAVCQQTNRAEEKRKGGRKTGAAVNGSNRKCRKEERINAPSRRAPEGTINLL